LATVKSVRVTVAHVHSDLRSCRPRAQSHRRGFAPGHAQRALTQEVTAIFGSIEIFVMCVRRPKFRKALEKMVDDVRQGHQASPDELVEWAQEYHFERWRDEM
jgi:hypothetical protein